MEAPELYSQHARVWLPDAVEVWRSAELRRGFSPGDRALALRLEDGTEVEHTVDLQTGGLPPLRNPDLLVGENDLTTLSFLHEPAVLHNLRVRFIDSKLIYTYCGIVLVAINPYDSLAIYDTDIISAYSGQNMGDMDPHIFAVAEEAFKHMARCERNQSIIVSGESGAGKTVSAKYVMRYFAAVSRSSAEANVEEKVLASNPIMEAIGNAKTTRNDNSSRFGKYIEIGFNKKNCMIGAKMKTYLLEKSRVVFQAQGERNYHIFYQLCASSHLPEFQALKLGCADDFHCANQGQSPEIDGVDDARDMSVTRRALSLLGFSNSDQSALFQILAGILHLSNVEVNGQTADSCRIVPDQEPLVLFSGLMGVPHADMAHWLCHRKLKTTAETYVKTLSRENAVNGRDALAKHIYARIFNWIVDHINRTLTFVAAQRSFIGVLDIYGFETFDINSFEQFCINYANEKLQQQFNLHVFKLEQEEYMKEQIPWSLIDFYDNEPCIKLIEAKMGVLDLLDEECKMPKASDDTWAQKLYSSLLKQNVHFDKPRLSNRAFIIHHFADKVEYQCDGFLEKNKDTVNEDQINVLKTSKFDLVLKLLQEDEATTGSKGCSSKRERPGKVLRDHKKTVGLQFRQSLHSLMETLNATTPHYVRCIKPNDQKAPFTLDPVRTVQQLRSCGILETIRISAAGFPSRWTYQEFFSRYRVLMKRKEVLPDYKQSCKIALEKLVKDRDQYQFGKNKIFFRAGQVAFLENLRSEKLRSACVCIQKTMRCWLARKKYLRMRESAVTIQKHVRAHQARCYVKFVRWTKAAVIIQQYFRMWAARRSYRRQQFAAVTIQSCFRAYKAKQNYYKLVFEQKTVVIQKWVRGWLARRHFGRVLAAVVLLQSCVRRRRAREALRQLKVEARSVEHFKKLNVGMENKIMQLQRKNDEQHQANRELSVKLRAVEKTQAAEREKLLRAEQQSSAKAERVSGLLEQLSFLHRELETNRREKEERDRAHQEHTEKMEAELNARNSLLITEKEDLSRRIQEQAKQITDTKVILENTKQVEKDLTEERSRYQSLLSEYLQLEQRHAELKEKMNQYKREDKAGHKKTELTVVRMRRTSVQSSDEQESPAKREDVKQPAVDMPILLKLQRRLKELETVNRSLQRQLERRTEVQQEKAKVIEEQKSLNRAELDLEALKRQELESENKRLKLDLNMLRKSLSGENRALAPPKPDSLSYSVLLEQLDSSNEELEMRKEEVMLLRSHMVRQEALKHKDSLTEGLKLNLSEMSLLQDIERSTDLHTLNEDGELWLAYEGLKETNRLLEGQLQEQGQQHREECEELQKELQKVKEQNLQQQQLLTKSLQLPQDAQIEARLQHEITRLANENLDHMERQESQDKTINNLKKQLKTYAKRLEEFEAGARKQSTVSQIGIPVSITRKEKEFQGMLEYKQGDESLLLKNLVVDLKPRGVAVSFIPGLPAYIIFMCIRYADYIDDEDRVSTLLNSTIISIKGVIKRRGADFETVSFWLANTCRFLHCLKQYSGDEDFTKHNTPRQNEHCLANFELSGYQQVFGDLAIQIYQQLIKCTEELLQPLIVAAMLEHETVQGVLGSRPTGLRKRSASLQDEGGVTVETLLQQLNVFHSAMIQHGMDPELVKQVVKQVFHIICGMTLNNLVLRKDMCSWGKGLQIRYKVWQLEEWLSEKELADCGARDTLEPLIQAAQLLQIKKKTEADAQAICTMCSALTAAQIVKVLNLYTPVIEFEERVSNTFIAIIEELLKDRRESPALMMDVKTLFPVSLPFSPSLVTLDSIQIPISLNLSFLTRV